MGALFGKSKKKESRITAQDKAILQLKQQRDKLKQYQKKIIINLEKERLLAKQLLSEGKKEKAKLLLRKKRFAEQMLSKTDVQLMNLERMAHDLEFAQIEIQVVEGLKVGNESLHKLHEMLSLEEIEKIMDDTQDAIEKQQEIDALLSGGLSTEDEEAVLEELDSIIAESLPEVGKEEVPIPEVEEQGIALPEVPDEEPAERPKKILKEERRQLVAAT